MSTYYYKYYYSTEVVGRNGRFKHDIKEVANNLKEIFQEPDTTKLIDTGYADYVIAEVEYKKGKSVDSVNFFENVDMDYLYSMISEFTTDLWMDSEIYHEINTAILVDSILQ